MADAFKLLAKGQLAATVGVLYTVPVDTKVIIKNVKWTEATGAGGPYDIDMFIGGGDPDDIWHHFSLDDDEGAEWDGTLALEAGQTIRGKASSASKITYIISGDEVT